MNNKRVKTLLGLALRGRTRNDLNRRLPAHCPERPAPIHPITGEEWRIGKTGHGTHAPAAADDRRMPKRCCRHRVVVVNVGRTSKCDRRKSFPLRPVRLGRRTTTRSTTAVMAPDALAGCRSARRRIDTRRHPHAGGLLSGTRAARDQHASYRPRGDS